MHNPLTCSIFLVSNGFECNAVDYFKNTTNLEMGNLHLVQEQLARQDIQSGIKLLNKEKPWIRTQKKKKDRKFNFVLRESFSLHKTLEQFRRIPARSNSTHGWFLNARSQLSRIHPKNKTRKKTHQMHTLAYWVSPKRLQEQHSERINRKPKNTLPTTTTTNCSRLLQETELKISGEKNKRKESKSKNNSYHKKRKKEREDQEEEDWS